MHKYLLLSLSIFSLATTRSGYMLGLSGNLSSEVKKLRRVTFRDTTISDPATSMGVSGRVYYTHDLTDTDKYLFTFGTDATALTNINSNSDITGVVGLGLHVGIERLQMPVLLLIGGHHNGADSSNQLCLGVQQGWAYNLENYRVSLDGSFIAMPNTDEFSDNAKTQAIFSMSLGTHFNDNEE